MLEAKGLGENLRHARPRGRWTVDFRVQSGEIVGLLGLNGAGKTTSFRMTCGMIVPQRRQKPSLICLTSRLAHVTAARCEGGMGDPRPRIGVRSENSPSKSIGP